MGESPFESTTMEAPLFRLPTEPIKRTPNEFEFEWHPVEGMFAWDCNFVFSVPRNSNSTFQVHFGKEAIRLSPSSRPDLNVEAL